MTKQLITILVGAALAACGSKSTAPKTPDPDRSMPDGNGSGSAVVVAPEPDKKPTEPTKPVEPPKPDPEKVKAEFLAAEMAAFDKAKPVFDKSCASCHTKTGKKSAKKKLDHMDMTTYPFGGHHTGTIGITIREVLGITGQKPTMPFDKPGSVKDADLAAIKAWTDAWEAAEKAGVHPKVAADHDGD